MTRPDKDENLDRDVIDRFGREWADFDYSELDTEELLMFSSRRTSHQLI